MYDKDFNVLGIPTVTGIVSEGRRRQLWDYPHGNPDYSTILPCDFIKVGNFWYVAAMVTQGLGNEKRTIFWMSRNLVDWEKTNPYVSLKHRDDNGNHIGHPGNTMLTFDQIDDWVYIFGTNGLARDQHIWLWRSPATNFPYGTWDPWGYDGFTWDWGHPNENSPVLPGRYGELCFRYIQNNCVLSFFDVNEYCCSALTVPFPTDDWTAANRIDYAHGPEFSQLYGGYISPDSKLNEPNGMKFLVSQWDTSDNDPYHVVAFADTLTAQGPVTIPTPLPTPAPEPIPIPTPEPPVLPVVTPPKPEEKPVPPPTPAPAPIPTDPQALYQLLLRELAASGSTLITTPEGQNITLRMAVEQVFWKERGWHDMTERPRHPASKDDQLGHVLSMRAEVEFVQACVVALCDQAGIDTAALYARVKASLDGQK